MKTQISLRSFGRTVRVGLTVLALLLVSACASQGTTRHEPEGVARAHRPGYMR